MPARMPWFMQGQYAITIAGPGCLSASESALMVCWKLAPSAIDATYTSEYTIIILPRSFLYVRLPSAEYFAMALSGVAFEV